MGAQMAESLLIHTITYRCVYSMTQNLHSTSTVCRICVL